MALALAHWLNAMHPTPGNTASDRLEDAARAVEPKDTWTPVSADEAERVVRALVDEAAVDETRAEASEGPGADELSRGRAGPKSALAAGALIFLVATVVILALNSRNPAQSGHETASLAGPTPPHGHPSSPGEAAHNPIQEQEQEMNRATVAAAAAGLIVAGESFAQSAVQWRVEDGGNGHWYLGVRFDSLGKSWTDARAIATAQGGDLASLNTLSERAWVFAHVSGDPALWTITLGPWIGAIQPAGSSEPAGGWQWVDGSPFYDGFFWDEAHPDGNDACGGPANRACYWGGYTLGVRDQFTDCADLARAACWNIDFGAHPSAVIEWSADCNSDGIVDYGQCRDGSLPDFNSNNVPDCCEAGDPCVVDRYPIQWRESDGGNGHWYLGVRFDSLGKSWTDARTIATAQGGDLVSLNTLSERAWVFARVSGDPALWTTTLGPWIGAIQPPGSPEPAGGWQWVDGSPFYDGFFWDEFHPDGNDACGGPANRACYWGDYTLGVRDQFTDCADLARATCWNIDFGAHPSAVIEWSADCNADGIIDYGQILSGSLPDENSNGVPDSCELPSCADADLTANGTVDGADLGALLAFWGPVNPVFPQADINGDGAVNGADLGVLLSVWGPCGG
jgi:hypothetical protein